MTTTPRIGDPNDRIANLRAYAETLGLPRDVIDKITAETPTTYLLDLVEHYKRLLAEAENTRIIEAKRERASALAIIGEMAEAVGLIGDAERDACAYVLQYIADLELQAELDE